MTRSNTLPNTAKLLDIMRKLRDPETGCPWDKRQSFSSIVPYTIEETYEVADAIFKGNKDDIKEELGDLLFQIVFYAQLGDEEGSFAFEDIAECISQKLVRRHPHVFAGTSVKDEKEATTSWQAIKAQEKEVKGKSLSNSVFDNLPSGLPPTDKTRQLLACCEKQNIALTPANQLVGILNTQLAQFTALQTAKIDDNSHSRDTPADMVPAKNTLTECFGDFLFNALHLARELDIDIDNALRTTNEKFVNKMREQTKEDKQ